jgi:hypothetical protein
MSADPTKTATSPFSRAADIRMEALSRLIAAEKMGLLNDPVGKDLPYDLWKQAEHLAAAVITLIRRSEVGHETIRMRFTSSRGDE